MLVIFAGRGVILVRIACVVLLPLSIFLSLLLYFSGARWGITIFVFVTVLLCLHLSISYRIAGGGEGLPVQQQQPEPQRGLGASLIAALPANAYENKASGAGDDCAVCLGELQSGEAVKRLPACAHLFHDGCIDAWLRSHVTCPVCRYPVDTALPAAAPE